MVRQRFAKYMDELLLYSGQYALFYVVMNFSKDGLHFFQYSGHVLMLAGLIAQILFLSKWGQKPMGRIFGSLICPALYTLFEAQEFGEFIRNTGHFFFWVFSLLVGLMNAVNLKAKGERKNWIESVIIFMNVVMFLFIYMYFDSMTKLEEMSVNAGTILDEYSYLLSIGSLLDNIKMFLKDATHIYLIIGGTVLGISLSVGKIRINRLNEQIKTLFGTYLDPVIRDKVLAAGGVLEEKKSLAVLFCDIRNFTTLSETNGPSNTIGMLNEYFSCWEQVATMNDGVINKYIGDAVMILFGINEHPTYSAAESAINCAQDFRAQFAQMNQTLSEKHLPTVPAIGVGIHYGEVVLGNVGSERRREFTAIGDTVNIASRLESVTKELSEEGQELTLLISKAVFDRLDSSQQNSFIVYDTLMLKGKQEAIEVYKG
jgi:class 3 adenylate cyclase